MPKKQDVTPFKKIVKRNEELMQGVNTLLKLQLIPRTPTLSWQIAVIKAENKILKSLTLIRLDA